MKNNLVQLHQNVRHTFDKMMATKTLADYQAAERDYGNAVAAVDIANGQCPWHAGTCCGDCR